MAVVIADAGPLIALAKIGHLELLAALFSQVVITQTVADECLRREASDAHLIRQAIAQGWLSCVDNPAVPVPYSRSLGLGELSSIAYALQSETPCLLIMDDALARKHALRQQLDVIGTAALLFGGQRKGLVADAQALVTRLNQIGYRITPAVVAQLAAQQTD